MTLYIGTICGTELVRPKWRVKFKAMRCPNCDSIHGFRKVDSMEADRRMRRW